MDLISKDDKMKIDAFNAVLRTNYRNIPYDFTKPTDIIEATIMITAEFIDMSYYCTQLSDISERLDESLEVFYPAKWMAISLGEDLKDNEMEEALENIRCTENSFYKLMERAEKKCSDIWRIVFIDFNREVRRHFFGEEEINFERVLIEDLLNNELLEVLDRMEYQYNTEKAVEDFSKHLLSALKSKQAKAVDI